MEQAASFAPAPPAPQAGDGRRPYRLVGGINIIDDLNMPEPRSPRFDYAVCGKARCWNPFHKAMCELWSRFHQHGIDHLRAAIAAFPPVANAVGDHHAWFAFRDNVQHQRDIEREYLTAILAAKSDILIANAYFFPALRFRRALLRARRRGCGCGCCFRATGVPAAALCHACVVRNAARRRR